MSETEVGTEPTPPVDTPIDAAPAAEADTDTVLAAPAATAADTDTVLAAPAASVAEADTDTVLTAPAPTVAEPDDAPQLDLDAIARELADVEHALRRLDDGTYWTDELTGAPIPDEILAADPTARRAVR